MNSRKVNRHLRPLMIISAVMALIFAVIGVMQPVLDKILGGGTLFATSVKAEEGPLQTGKGIADQTSSLKGGTAPRSTSKDQSDSGLIFATDPMSTLVNSVYQKEKEQEERKRDLQKREKELLELEARIDEKLDKLMDLREQFNREQQNFINKVNSAKTKEAKKWAEIYATVDAKLAAKVLEALEDSQVAVDQLSRMDPKQVKKILDAMSPEKARAIIEEGLLTGHR